MTAVAPIGHPKPASAPQPQRVGVLLVNLGTPDTADARGVRVYLKEFLSDPRVIEDQGLRWKLILNGIILRVRPAPQGARLPEDLEHREERIPAQDDHARAGRKACRGDRRSRACRGRLGDALRQSVDPLAYRCPDRARLRPVAGRAALSAIFRGDLGDRLRRSVSRSGRHARAADAAGDARLITTILIISRRSRSRSMRIWRACRFSPN